MLAEGGGDDLGSREPATYVIVNGISIPAELGSVSMYASVTRASSFTSYPAVSETQLLEFGEGLAQNLLQPPHACQGNGVDGVVGMLGPWSRDAPGPSQSVTPVVSSEKNIPLVSYRVGSLGWSTKLVNWEDRVR